MHEFKHMRRLLGVTVTSWVLTDGKQGGKWENYSFNAILYCAV